MTEIASLGSLKDEFRSLTPKQMLGIGAGMILALVLTILGGTICLGFILAPIFLYMLPHMLGVKSVKIKTIVGVVFVIAALLIGTFAFIGVEKDLDISEVKENDYINDLQFDDATDTISAVVTYDGDFKVSVGYVKVSGFRFGAPMPGAIPSDNWADMTKQEDGRYAATLDLDDDTYYILQVKLTYMDGEKEKDKAKVGFLVANGGEITTMMHFSGAAMGVAPGAGFYFLLLIFSTLMRRSLEKTRTKMEEEGRLYPKGYGKCKDCGNLVLPGEVTCRKCGAYIDVPEDIKADKKDYFVCTECGAEVPNDATECPKCGAKFEGEETEVVHADGTVDVSEETFECSECGAVVPVNATHCPKCGAKFDEEDEK